MSVFVATSRFRVSPYAKLATFPLDPPPADPGQLVLAFAKPPT